MPVGDKFCEIRRNLNSTVYYISSYGATKKCTYRILLMIFTVVTFVFFCTCRPKTKIQSSYLPLWVHFGGDKSLMCPKNILTDSDLLSAVRCVTVVITNLSDVCSSLTVFVQKNRNSLIILTTVSPLWRGRWEKTFPLMCLMRLSVCIIFWKNTFYCLLKPTELSEDFLYDRTKSSGKHFRRRSVLISFVGSNLSNWTVYWLKA